MKRKKIVLGILSLISILGLGLTSCSNQEVIKGEVGEQGPIGPAGEDGNDGKDGSIIHTGEGKPSDTLGKDTDVYIDSKTGNLYQKENGSWTLVMNIKGEDGKDGQDGSDGHNGSSGSDGKTAWSNTILPSEDGYITVNLGSSFVGDNIVFTFVPKTEDVSAVNWTVKNNGEAIIDLEKDEDPFTFETTMKEGGFVVSAEPLASKVEVTDADGFSEALDNLQPGENVIELSDDVDLTNLNESTETQVLRRLKIKKPISTFANEMENDWYLKAKVEVYIIDLTNVNNKKEKGVHLTIKSKGNESQINNKTLTVPFILVLGNGNDSVSFKNVNMNMVYKVNEIYQGKPEEMIDVHFFNGKGIDSLEFNSCTVSVKAPEEHSNLSTVNFINFDGRELILNNFEKTEENFDLMETFIRKDGNSNPNLEKVYANNTTVYGRQFISYYPHNGSTLDVEVNNSEFHALINQPIISLRVDSVGLKDSFSMNCTLHNFDYYGNSDYMSNFNVLTSISNQTSAKAFDTGKDYTHEYVAEQISQMKKDPSAYKPQENFNVDLSGINLDISNLNINGNKLKSFDNHETIVSNTMGEYEQECFKGKDKYKIYMDIYENFPPVEYEFFTNYLILSEDCSVYNEDTKYYPHDIYQKIINDYNLYPSLTLNGKKVDKSTYLIFD